MIALLLFGLVVAGLLAGGAGLLFLGSRWRHSRRDARRWTP